MFEDLIEYASLLEASTDMFGFGDVTFKRDFGPWEQGQKVETLWFMIEGDPIVEEQSSDGKVMNSCKFQLTAIQ